MGDPPPACTAIPTSSGRAPTSPARPPVRPIYSPRRPSLPPKHWPAPSSRPASAEQIGATGRVTHQLLQDPNYSLHIGGDAEFLFNSVGTNTLTFSDRPELRIDPTVIETTGSMTNIAHAQVYSGEAAAEL